MGSNLTIFRPLLIASLLGSLSIAGLPPCLVSPGSCSAVHPTRAVKTCCCKGKCGRHCRMACCQAPAPTPDRAPAPTKVTDDLSPTWGLAANAATQFDATHAADFQHGISRSSILIGPSDSLLALSIRFNV